MDPFDIKFTPRPGMNEIACAPKDKRFGLNQETKDLRDKIDDKYKSVILGYNKSPNSSPFPSRSSRKPLFPLNRVAISTFMRSLPMSFYRYILMN
jgi:hypothetical protein